MVSWQAAAGLILFSLASFAIADGRRQTALGDQTVLWVPDNGDATRQSSAIPGVETNGAYVRRPAPGSDRGAWRRAMAQLRSAARREPRPSRIAIDFKGVRAWVRLDAATGRALDLTPGETVRVEVSARWISGSREIGIAFDYLDRTTLAWRGWSTIRQTGTLASDGSWRNVVLEVPVPDTGSPGAFANVIIGQDGTRDPSPSRWEIRRLTLRVPGGPERQRRVDQRLAQLQKPPPIEAGYDRSDLAWASKNVTCVFLFLYDLEAYDRNARRYRTEELIARWNRDFGGADSVVLWQAYPRIGVDDRNQFDFYRDMPGGLAGLRAMVDQLHQARIRVFLAYNPWDTGTRREPTTDADAIAAMVGALDADGVFLDTMIEAPAALRGSVDAVRRGVIFEPEGAPPIEQLGLCSSSWAQWLPEYPEPGVLLLKWIEPRHMQHQIRRWNRSHADEIRSAFLNGSGMLVWENVFGTWNPWADADRAAWSALAPVLRRFHAALSSESWEPFATDAPAGATVHRWTAPGSHLYLFHSPGSEPPTCGRLGIPLTAHGGEDVLSGAPVTASSAPLTVVNGLGGVVIRTRAGAQLPPRSRSPVRSSVDSGPRAATAPPPATPPTSTRPDGMTLVRGGPVHMALSHERRECGCAPDPGSPPDQAVRWAWGDPFHETLTHDYTVTVGPYWIDESLVTNGDFQRFLDATGYRPADPTRFLHHWGGGRCPASLLEHPVVYVDLEDARAYARWAGKRLPTEPEWQLAAQGDDGRIWPWGDAFDPARCTPTGTGTTPVRSYPSGRSPSGCYDMTGNVWQWTESETDDGHTRSCIIRGGSWFDAAGSIWYIHGGPQPLNTHTRFLLLYPGMDRCATIGFRCVRDAMERR